MKITDMHVTRIELSADEVDSVICAVAGELYRTAKLPEPSPTGAPPWMAPSVPGTTPTIETPPMSRAWDVTTETLRQQDGGAILTIRRSR